MEQVVDFIKELVSNGWVTTMLGAGGIGIIFKLFLSARKALKLTQKAGEETIEFFDKWLVHLKIQGDFKKDKKELLRIWDEATEQMAKVTDLISVVPKDVSNKLRDLIKKADYE